MEIIKDINNTLLKRQELVFETDSNVSFNEARKQIADKTKKSEEVIDVYNVKGGFVASNSFDNFANFNF